MVDSMHPRRHDNQIQNSFELNRQTPVGMMKEGLGLERDEKHDQHDWSNAEHQHREREEANGKNHFAKVESCSSRHVEIQICVMHVMNSPEERQHVHGPVPP